MFIFIHTGPHHTIHACTDLDWATAFPLAVVHHDHEQVRTLRGSRCVFTAALRAARTGWQLEITGLP